MQITGSIVLVTGANRGIGKAFVTALIELGAAKVYATARRLDTLDEVVEIAPDLIICIENCCSIPCEELIMLLN